MSDPRDEFERRFARRYADYLEDGVGAMHPKKLSAGGEAHRPWRAGSVQIAVLGAMAVVAAAVVTLAVLGVLPKITGPVGTASESPQASVAPSATPTASATSTASAAPTPTSRTPMATPSQPVALAWPTLAPSEASVPSSLDGQDFPFWTLYRPPPCCTNFLRVSTSSGSIERTIDVADSGALFSSTPAGPAGGRVVYVLDDGRTARLMVVDARTGRGAELTSTGLVIARLVIDPAGSTAYYLLFDRRTSAFAGLWAVSTSGGQPRPMTTLRGTTATATLVAERFYEPQLAVSTDGSWIVFATCPNGTDCTFYASHADGMAEPLDRSNLHNGDGIVGIAGDLLIGSTECPQAVCDGFVFDLRSGERWPLGGASAPFAPTRLIAGPHGPLILAQTADWENGLWTVEAMDLTNGRRSTVFRATFQPGVDEVHLVEPREIVVKPAGAELPPGWFLINRYGLPVDGVIQPPDYSAARVGATSETKLPVMKFSPP